MEVRLPILDRLKPCINHRGELECPPLCKRVCVGLVVAVALYALYSLFLAPPRQPELTPLPSAGKHILDDMSSSTGGL